ncbi:MAG: aromatic-ring-hydroxylating dioxygenase subunit beta [Gammaproteobacteria bacterium]
MSLAALLGDRVHQLLFEEAAALDERRWHDWLALFTPDCEYWVPAWKSAFETTSDPDGEVSLIYYGDRAGLEERVWRIESAASPAHRTRPRTCHAVNNIRIDSSGSGEVKVKANWHVDCYEEKRASSFFGHYEYSLVDQEGALLIARKKTLLLNDSVPSYVDIYQL